MTIRSMAKTDYDGIYALWMSCKNRGLNDVDDSRAGIAKAALLVFKRNEAGNAFWESQGFELREDVTYRNRALKKLTRIDT